MNNKSKIIIGVFITAFSLFAWWVSDIPIGYYQFKQMCKEEGGLRSYSVVEPNVGWLAKTESNAEYIVSHYPSVPFARFSSSDGAWHDVIYKGGNPNWGQSYEKKLANEKVGVGYRLDYLFGKVGNAIRLNKADVQLIDVRTDKIVFKVSSFVFYWTVPENTFLGKSGVAVCPDSKEEHSSIISFLKG